MKSLDVSLIFSKKGEILDFPGFDYWLWNPLIFPDAGQPA